MKWLDYIAAAGILAFGLAHCVFTFFHFSGYSDAAIWFFSGGLALIFQAGFNFLRIRYASLAPGIRRLCLASNTMTLGFVVVYLAGRWERALRSPHALLLIAFVLSATVFSLVQPPRSQDNPRLVH